MPPLRQLKTALITGCSSGIGQALALEFASRGYCVVATARNAADLLELEKLHPNIVAHELDVRSSESIRVLREEVRKLTGGGLDFLINNAGTHYGSTALDIDADQVRDVFEVNVVAVMLMCQAFAESLITARGVIVQIGSVTRAVPVVWQSPYNATKAALSQYTNTLRLELDPFGVRVVEVVTGYVQSKILRHGLHAPSDSLYLPIKEHIENIKNSGNRDGMSGLAYAKSVVDQVTKPTPPHEIWEGAGARQLWLIVTWLPQWLKNWLWKRYFQIERLRTR